MADYKEYPAAPEGTPVANFVHLHVHSDFSLLDSCATVDKLVAKAKSLNMPALALTDHGNMFGALYFEHLCHKNGINPIVGEEFYVAYGSHLEKNSVPYSHKGEDGTGQARYFHLILLCENETGYKNMSWLSSIAFTDGMWYKPRIDFELLEKYHEGLICCSACIAGEIPQLLLAGLDDEAREVALKYKNLFGADHYYIEIQDHGLEDQKIVNEKLIKLARELDIPLVATNDIHYIEREDAKAQDALRCIGFKEKLHEPHATMGGNGNDNWYFKTEQEMRSIFPDYPDAFDNTIKIADMCHLEIKQYTTPELKACLPRFELPKEFCTHGDDYQSDQNDYVKYLVEEGLKKRYKEITPEIRQRADYEMKTIFDMGFSGYFLIVWEFINWSKSTWDNVNNKPKPYYPIGPGRGSGAGSLVAYTMGITDIDPFRFGLFFERFLNPERVSMPDFDIDMDFDFRQDIIQHTRDLYGDECVGHIVTFGTLKPKNCIADVGRILDIPLNEVAMLKKCIPDDDLKIKLIDALSPPTEKHPKGGQLIPYKDDPRYTELFELALKLEGCKRNTGLHASGMVIGLTPLPDWAPVFKDAKTGEVGVQYTMDIIEPCGLVKFDYLGLKTLSLIRYAEDIINRHKKPGTPDLVTAQVSESDEETFKLFKRGDSAAVFQFESPGMSKILKQLQPEKLEDLVALNALYRPGPMDYIPQFIDGKWKPETVHYPDPSLEGCLKETYGVMVYQEQIMKVAQIIAGFSLGGADLLRRAMGKKKPEVLEGQRKNFIEGALKNGHTKEHANDIFEIMVPFAGYGFNKSHAAAYSVLAYRTGYLKAHYPAEFMAANLTNERNSADKLPEYLGVCKNMGIPIVQPDVNLSDKYFDAYDGKIIYGLAGIKGLGEGIAEAIIKERNENGPYQSFIDFLDRLYGTGINKKALEVLIKTGSFDKIEDNRKRLMVNMERAVSYINSKKEATQFGQAALFGEEELKEVDAFKYEEIEDWTLLERLAIEKELTGFYLSGHPLDQYEKVLKRCTSLNSAKLSLAINGNTYIAAGMVKEIRPILTKSGKYMGLVTITDYEGDLKMTFFSKEWDALKDQIHMDEVMAFKGKVSIQEKWGPSFQVNEILDINSLQETAIRNVHVKLSLPSISKNEINDLLEIFVANQGDCSLYLHIENGGKTYVIRSNNSLKISSSDEFLESLKQNSLIEEAWKD